MRLFAFILVLTLLFSFAVSGEVISINPCTAPGISEDGQNYYYTSSCYDITFPKQYTNDISFFDKYNGDAFDLKLFSLIEQNADLPAQIIPTDFHTMGLTAYVQNDVLYYLSADNTVRLSYQVVNNRVKANVEIWNWTGNYANTNLILRTRIQKEDSASHFENYAAWVDGIEQPLIVESVTQGVNEFFEQTLYTGSSFSYLWIDPVFVVDYSPEPGLHLINGTVASDPDTSFAQSLNITTGLSDNSDSTVFEIRESPSVLDDNIILISNYRLEETSGPTLVDSSGNGLNGQYFGTPIFSDSLLNGNAIDFNGTGFANVSHDTLMDINASEDMMVCFTLKADAGELSNGEYLLTRRNPGDAGWEIRSNGGDIEFISDRSGSGQKKISIAGWEDSSIRKVCYFNGFTNHTVYVNGSVNTIGSASQSGTIAAVGDFHIATNDAESGFLPVQLDEICYLKGVTLDAGTIAQSYSDNNGCVEFGADPSKGIAISGFWNQTYDPVYQWFLNIRKTSAGSTDIMVYPYNGDNVSINTSISKTTTINGIGNFSVNVSTLLDFQTNNLSLTYTHLRFYTTDISNVSELRLRKEVNDTENPAVFNCQLNTTLIGCTDIVRLQCNVTDNVEVNDVNFTINGTNFTGTKNDELFYYDFSGSGFDSIIYNWGEVHAVDILGLVNTSTVNLNFNYTCNQFIVNADIPQNNSVDVNNIVDYFCSVDAPETIVQVDFFRNGSLINSTFPFSSTVNETYQENISDNSYNWYCSAEDNIGSRFNSTVNLFTVDSFQAPIINTTEFSGNTTNFTAEPDITNVCDPIIETSFGRIQWFGCVNASGANFSEDFILSFNAAGVNTDIADLTFNISAQIIIKDVDFNGIPAILRDGEICPPSICSPVLWNDTDKDAIFNVTGFSTYVATASTALTIFDDTDTITKLVNQTVLFSANYTNLTSGSPITDGVCSIQYPDNSTVGMVYNGATQNYEDSNSFGTAGNFSFFVNCTHPILSDLNATDDFLISNATPFQFIFVNVSNNTAVNLSSVGAFLGAYFQSWNETSLNMQLFINGSSEQNLSFSNNTLQGFTISSINTTGFYTFEVTSIFGSSGLYNFEVVATVPPSIKASNATYIAISILLIGAIGLIAYLGINTKKQIIKLFFTSMAAISTTALSHLANIIATTNNFPTNVITFMGFFTIFFLVISVFVVLYVFLMIFLYVTDLLALVTKASENGEKISSILFKKLREGSEDEPFE